MNYVISTRDLIVVSYDFLAKNFKALFKLTLTWSIVVFLETIAYVNIVSAFGETYQALVWGFLVQLPFSLLLVVVIAALILEIDAIAHRKSIPLKQSLLAGIKKFPPLLVAWIVVGALTVIGFILLVVPGVIFWVWFAFTSFVIMLEHQGFRDAMKQSRDLSRGRFWKVFWRIFAPTFFWALTGFLILGIIDSALSLAGLKTLAQQSAEWSIVYNLVSALIQSIVNAVVSVLFIIITYLLYDYLKKQ